MIRSFFYINTLAFVSPRIHCVWISFGLKYHHCDKSASDQHKGIDKGIIAFFVYALNVHSNTFMLFTKFEQDWSQVQCTYTVHLKTKCVNSL